MTTRKKLNAEAYEAGKQARGDGRPREARHPYSKRPVVADWLAGWDEGGPEITTPEPVVEHHEPEVQTRGGPARYWPDRKPFPTAYSRPPVPCDKPSGGCGRTLTDEGGRAVLLRQTWQAWAYFRCRCCGHHWKLRVANR